MIEVLVGVIGRPHGIRGELAVEPRTDEPELRFAPGAVVRIEGEERRLTVDAARDHAGRLLVRFREIADRSTAETLRGTRLVVDVDAQTRPERPEEFYDRQLIGLAVLDSGGTTIGQVARVTHLPSQDLLEIDTDAGPRMVPFVSALVPEVDLDQGRIRLADLPGLLTDEDAD